jgi:hypothetical protein
VKVGMARGSPSARHQLLRAHQFGRALDQQRQQIQRAAADADRASK